MHATGDSRAEFKPVMEDLEHLRADWSKGPADAVLRRGSVILRGFFCDNLLQRTWRAFGFEREPIIVGPNLELLLGPDLARAEVALAGGADAPGVYAAGFLVVQGNTAGGDPNPPANALEFPFLLGTHVGATSAVVAGKPITRLEVVKYFANAKGGAHLHLSSRGRKREEELVKRVS